MNPWGIVNHLEALTNELESDEVMAMQYSDPRFDGINEYLKERTREVGYLSEWSFR